MFQYFYACITYACIKCGNRLDYESGAKVAVTVTPSKGWKFVRWQGSGSGTTNPLEITISGEQNIVAVFEQDLIHIVASVSPNYGAASKYYCKGTIEIVVDGQVVNKKDQTVWTNSVMILSTDLVMGKSYTVKFKFYMSENGSSIISKGSVRTTSEKILNIGSGGLIQYEESGTAGDNAGSFGHDHGITIQSLTK